MDKAKSSETGYSGNMLDFPANKEERVLAHILATKFHTELAIDSWLEVRLNPTMKDLVINSQPLRRKGASGRGRRNPRLRQAESVGENQPVWLDSLKEEIAKMK
jgi:hypothetical protein